MCKALLKQLFNIFVFLNSSALRDEKLLLVQTGSSSPCLDLRYVGKVPLCYLCPSAAGWSKVWLWSIPATLPAGNHICTPIRSCLLWIYRPVTLLRPYSFWLLMRCLGQEQVRLWLMSDPAGGQNPLGQKHHFTLFNLFPSAHFCSWRQNLKPQVGCI